MSKLIRTVLYKFGFVHYENVISGCFSGSEEVGSAVDGYMRWPGGGAGDIHIEFIGTVVDPDTYDPDVDEPFCVKNSCPGGDCPCEVFVRGGELTP